MGVIAKILAKQSERAVARVKGLFTGSEEQQKRDYPLGLHLNAVLRFDPTDFILAGESLKVRLPAGDALIMAIGEFRCLGVPTFRFYLKDLEDNEWVLQLADRNGSCEVVIYQTIDEVFPDDWGFWLNNETGLIGYKDFQTPDQITYFRMLHSPGPDYASPVEFRENLKGNEDAFFVDHAMMLYGRDVQVNGGLNLTEYLLVSREVDEEGALVRIMAGVPVDPMSMTVL